MAEEVNLTDPSKPTTAAPERVKPGKRKGLVIVHTGDGKGKSSSAFGMVIRTALHKGRVGVMQFIKGKWKTADQKIPGLFPGQIDWKIMGEGFTWETKNRARDVEAAMKGWGEAKRMILEGDYALVLLDEINVALRYEFIPLSDVLDTLKKKPEMLHVVLTGRDAKPELIELADLVTEMKPIKHPYREQGITAQKGIEF